MLHSSVDIEECLRSIGRAEPGDQRQRVILATNVAESSLTIPDVVVVVDLCRRMELRWDRAKREKHAEIRWASQSQCQQRAGRAGRVQKGVIYRCRAAAASGPTRHLA